MSELEQLYVPVYHGNWPEDGQEIGRAYETKERAEQAGESREDASYNHSQFFVKGIEVVRE